VWTGLNQVKKRTSDGLGEHGEVMKTLQHGITGMFAQFFFCNWVTSEVHMALTY
jgi:hypothetical protein